MAGRICSLASDRVPVEVPGVRPCLTLTRPRVSAKGGCLAASTEHIPAFQPRRFHDPRIFDAPLSASLASPPSSSSMRNFRAYPRRYIRSSFPCSYSSLWVLELGNRRTWSRSFRRSRSASEDLRNVPYRLISGHELAFSAIRANRDSLIA